MSYVEHFLDEKNCEICDQGGEEDKILLCDRCDSEFHMFCLRPKLNEVPEGEWLCPLCSSTGSTSHLENFIQNSILKSTKISSRQTKFIDDDRYSEISLIPKTYDSVGCLIRLYCPNDMCYHSGRIIAQRLHNGRLEEEMLEHLVQFQKYVIFHSFLH